MFGSNLVGNVPCKHACDCVTLLSGCVQTDGSGKDSLSLAHRELVGFLEAILNPQFQVHQWLHIGCMANYTVLSLYHTHKKQSTK